MKRFMVWTIALVFLFCTSGIVAAQTPAAPAAPAATADSVKADAKVKAADKKADAKAKAADKKAEAPVAPATK